MPASLEPQKVRLLQHISERERELAYFSGHSAKAMLEMISDGLVSLNGGIIRITDSGSRVLRNNGAIRPRQRPPPKLVWWITMAAALMLLSHLCMYCFGDDDHARHHDHDANRWDEHADAA